MFQFGSTVAAVAPRMTLAIWSRAYVATPSCAEMKLPSTIRRVLSGDTAIDVAPTAADAEPATRP